MMRLFLILMVLAQAAWADGAREDALFREIRCVVCQGESIAESHAPVAADMRKMVTEQIAAGRSDDDIREWLRSRYGDAVLMTPPVKPATWLLWAGPFLVFGIGALAAWRMMRRTA